ncbi:MAG: metallophosphoesterase [Bacteroidota bacterium]
MRESVIHKAIERCRKSAGKFEFDIRKDQWILFSDHHRGVKDGADDFQICEPAYRTALNYYDEKNFNLALLGDVEEFWENPIYKVVLKYREIMQLEKKFFDKSRLFRIWGNHDDQWQFGNFITKYLDFLFPQIEVHEGIDLSIIENGRSIGNVLLIHGHQGSLESDRFALISKFFVRYVWRNIQRVFKIPLSTPSTDLTLRSKHDMSMYNWTLKRKNQVLICGHTHQAVFESRTMIDRMTEELEGLENEVVQAQQEKEIWRILRKIEDLKQKYTALEAGSERVPRYFNTGACSYADGDITGIELDRNTIRLIKWTGGDYSEREILEESTLNQLFK